MITDKQSENTTLQRLISRKATTKSVNDSYQQFWIKAKTFKRIYYKLDKEYIKANLQQNA